MKKRLGLLAVLMAVAGVARAEDLAANFVNPPPSARAHTWWHWMNGNITKDGITADLEAMARVGVGGAQIFNADCGIVAGPVAYNTDEWRALVKHAAAEAQRLGVEICIHNCAGWSSSGGPWNTPEHGMQIVVTSETKVQGPARFAGVLPQPPTKLDCYRDIAVLAFRTPAVEATLMKGAGVKVTTTAKKGEGEKLLDGKPGSALAFLPPTAAKPQFILFEFAQPYSARTLTLTPAGGMRGLHGKLEVSDDGQKFRAVESISIGRGGEQRVFTFTPVTARFYRLLFTGIDAKMKQFSIGEVELSPKLGIEGLAGKVFLDRGGEVYMNASAQAQPGEVVARDQIVDLSAQLAKDGTLAWDAPAGQWTVVRFGYTPNGRSNHPAPKSGTGLEVDKLSAEAAQAFWDGGMAKLLKELGPLAGKSFNNVLIDSYEVGTQNWTPKFREEFQQRRGYDCVRFLPVLTGRVVDNPDVTERFLWDFRRTIADLFAAKYAGKFAELAHQSGLLFSCEPYGNCPSDDLQYGSYADIPMGEFWPGGGSPGNAKFASTLAHVYGRKFVGAESFTASPEQGKWLKDPYSLKAQGDLVWCGGINRYIFHRYAHQPWTAPNRYPGMTMGQWGTHFERTLTWWEQGRAWLTYIARSQYLLQSGRFFGDVLFCAGEGAPNSGRGGGLPPGYDYDICCAEALLNLVSVQDGRIVLPSGMSYRVLALADEGAMTPALLRKLKQLAEAGAVIVGKKPAKSPSLAGYPACDEEVKKLADELWGKGIKDQSASEALAALGLPPDFEAEGASVSAPAAKAKKGKAPASMAYIHRVAEGADIYFVSNQKEAATEVACTFRVAGRQPELWHPDTGVMEKAPVFAEADGRTTVPLRFDPAGSVFVVFRDRAPADHVVAVQQTAAGAAAAQPPPELKIVKAEYGFFGAASTDCADVTAKVKLAVKSGNRKIKASTDLNGGTDPAPNEIKELRVDFLLNGGRKTQSTVENATFEVPAGAEIIRALYGIIGEEVEAKSSQVADVTAKLNELAKDGTLSVEAGNALVGHDPANMIHKEMRVTYTYRGATKFVRLQEHQTLNLPDESDRPTPPVTFDLAVAADGRPAVYAWQPVNLELKTAAGQTLKAATTAVPAPVEIAGAWDLAFPPNWGAPAAVKLDKLISWTDHADQGVKYFSGTATYRKTFSIPHQPSAINRVFLDLGLVKNLAEVRLNGRDLGILWKPPFRVEVTDALRDGKNELVVQITNLWPNRLIGDEQLPEDREWNGIQLKAWPQWVLDGKPSPTGRFTFTTWHHWTKADELLPSGLLGPVLLRTAVQVPARP